MSCSVNNNTNVTVNVRNNDFVQQQRQCGRSGNPSYEWGGQDRVECGNRSSQACNQSEGGSMFDELLSKVSGKFKESVENPLNAVSKTASAGMDMLGGIGKSIMDGIGGLLKGLLGGLFGGGGGGGIMGMLGGL
jgi:hypothetical protein